MAKTQPNNTTYTDSFGNPHTSGLYAMVSSWKGNKGVNKTYSFTISIFKDSETRTAWENGVQTANPIKIPELEVHTLININDPAVLSEHFPINGEHPIGQFYEYLNATNHPVWSVWTDSI